MLDHLKEGPKLRTSLMQAAGTSWTVYRHRLDVLLQHGLIKEVDDMERSIELTQKGFEFTRHYENLLALFPKE
jgi:predicted transcriptional regulator